MLSGIVPTHPDSVELTALFLSDKLVLGVIMATANTAQWATQCQKAFTWKARTESFLLLLEYPLDLKFCFLGWGNAVLGVTHA